MGIGQDKMLLTPLQMVNSICIVANKGFYYTPHFVKDIEGAAEEDTLLSRFHQKHTPATHISDAAYEVVHSGMQDVIEIGTGRSARIPGIDICGKTGTAENKQRIDGRVVKLITTPYSSALLPGKPENSHRRHRRKWGPWQRSGGAYRLSPRRKISQ